MNRFLIIEKSDPVSMQVVSEKKVSDRIDMDDCYDGEYEVFYLNDDGSLEKIKVTNFVSADAESWENGISGYGDFVTVNSKKVVGTFTKTDH